MRRFVLLTFCTFNSTIFEWILKINFSAFESVDWLCTDTKLLPKSFPIQFVPIKSGCFNLWQLDARHISYNTGVISFGWRHFLVVLEQRCLFLNQWKYEPQWEDCFCPSPLPRGICRIQIVGFLHRCALKVFDATPIFMTTPTDKREKLTASLESSLILWKMINSKLPGAGYSELISAEEVWNH